jgi:RNA polymerase sigma factor (sigma-70 family)
MAKEELVRRAAAGDERAWRELVTCYERLLYSIAAGFHMRRCDADDAVQQTWIALLGSIDALRNPECVGGWLARVMRRNCIHIRERQRREDHEDPTETWAVTADAAIVDRLVFDEMARVLWTVVGRLPERERGLLRALFDGDERSYREIARCLSMPVGSIGPVRKRALERLPAMLAEVGLTVDDLHAVA